MKTKNITQKNKKTYSFQEVFGKDLKSKKFQKVYNEEFIIIGRKEHDQN